MNIIVHHPKNQQDSNELQKFVANIHAQAVIQHINKLPCPKEQRLKLCDEIQKA